MHKKWFFFSLSFISTIYGRYYCPPGLDDHIKVTANAMYLRRSDFPRRTLAENTAVLDADGDPVHVLKSQNLSHHWDWRLGLYGNLTYVASEKTSLEALYFYVYPWHGREVVGSMANSLAFPFHDPGFTTDYINASLVVAKYTSQLQNGEFNFWRHRTPRRINYFSVSWILGFRCLFLDEKLKLTYTQSTDQSDYRIQTKNFLYGAQFGGVFEINPSPRWTWTVMVKGAGFANNAIANVFLGDQNNTLILRNYEKNRWVAAFLLDGIGSLTYQCFEHLNIHVGYQAFLATGVALAPRQLDKGTGHHRKLNTDNNIVLDGAFAGLTLSF